jgi:hypothetical protein
MNDGPKGEWTMIRFFTLLLMLTQLGLLSACSPEVSRAVYGTLPVERRTECESACRKLGLELSAMVLMMSSAGCVCQVPQRKESTVAPGGGLGAGATTIAAAQAAASASAQAAAVAAQIAYQQQQQQQQAQRKRR